MALKLMGRKRGMTQVFDDKGRLVVCTVIEAKPNIVTQIKTKERDGYQAAQVAFEEVTAKDPRRKEKRTAKPQRGHFAKAGVEPRRHLAEFRYDVEGEYEVGQELGIAAFADVAYVDVTGTSKGKGFQGVMKLHNFSGGPAAHGSGFHRHAGSTGMRSTPGRCLPGGKRACQMGNRTVTVQGLEVVQVLEDDALLLVKGQVPGANGGLVYIAPAVKKTGKAATKK